MSGEGAVDAELASLVTQEQNGGALASGAHQKGRGRSSFSSSKSGLSGAVQVQPEPAPGNDHAGRTSSKPNRKPREGGGPLSFLCGCFRPRTQDAPEQDQRPSGPGESTAPQAAVPGEKRTALLPQLLPQSGKDIGRKTLVLDLDETLVHSSFRPVANAHIILTVEIEGVQHKVYVMKRPGVDGFLDRLSQIYEVVVWTASMAKYADPLLDRLDSERTLVSHRLFREACSRFAGAGGGYVKDLSLLGRDLRKVIIIDNSPMCYALQPDNAIPIKTWFDDMSDQELHDLVPILEALAMVDDIPVVLRRTLSQDDEEDMDDG